MAETRHRARRYPKRPLSGPTAFAAGLLLFVPASHGLGFGPPQASAIIGSPLSFSQPLRLQPGEAFDPECVKVEVQVGDRRLPTYALRWQVVPGGRTDEQWIQVSTLGVLDEPVVTVQVNSGCPSTASRRITLLTQLPGAAVPASGAGLARAELAVPSSQRVASASASRPTRASRRCARPR